MNQDINYWIARCASLEQELDMMKEQSTIKWRTGEPKSHGRYLIQTKDDGLQIAFWSSYVQSWSLYHNSEIIAWCKLSDIEPYKES